jgi:membrane-associated protein
MPYAKFASANVVGALSWGALLVLAGYAADSLPWIRTVAYVVAGTAILFSVVAPLVHLVRRRRAARTAR